MKLINLALAMVLASMPVSMAAQASRQGSSRESKVLTVINNYRPGSTGYGEMKVEKVSVDPAKRTVRVKCNTATSYLPLTAESLASLKAEILRSLGLPSTYKVVITADGHTLDELALFANKKEVRTPSPLPFVTRHEAQPAPAGLDGANIALWQSHGWYFEPKLNRWEWQRARIFQTVEDLYTQSYVMPFLMPMLENAGAYVISPRERDTNSIEIIIDADNAATPGFVEFAQDGSRWTAASKPGFAWDGGSIINGQNPFRDGSARSHATTTDADRQSHAVWGASIPQDGTYAVYVSYVTEPNSATDARYTVNTAVGPRHFTVNQQMGGGTWIYLGHFPLKAGYNEAVVQLSNLSATDDAVVTADAVKIGGGMGNVARIVKEPLDSIDYQYTLSGYPRWTEGARYWLQWAGAPDSVFTPTEYVNDYTDDYRSRGMWVNWIGGGSSAMPGREGLGIPVDLSLAFHTDAGTFNSDSIVGTLGIYCTVGDTLGNGSSRLMSRDYTDLVMTNIVNDVRVLYEPRWTRRGMWDKSYFEARVPEVPAMLLELLSHQNFADMKYGLDPTFRFAVSRAIYKGMLQFLAHRDGREYVVQPLAVRNFAIQSGQQRREYRLTWEATPDTLEATAMPTYYIVEHRLGDALGFEQVAIVDEPAYTVTISDKDIHSYRIIAGNAGGVSFPSEVLALCDLDNGLSPVLVVNGFTRVSAPDWFEAGDIAGFYDMRDHGVPYVSDISFIGSQFEFRRDIPWMDDDAAGFGASRSNYESKVIAGNTFDYVYTHGCAIVAAGRSFVSASVDAYMASPVAGEPAIVDLILGKQKEIARGRGVYGTAYKTFPGALQRKIAAATAAGTSFFVSGAFVATDLWDNPHSSAAVAKADQAFATDVLGYHWRVGQASTEGEAYEVPCRFKAFDGGNFDFSNTLNAECYAVESPDSFYASDKNKGCTIMRYNENNLVAGTASDMGGYRTVIIGFPFETIATDESRSALMRQILNFFTVK